MRPRLTHIALRVRDLKRSVAFYEAYAKLVVCHERVDDGVQVVWLAERKDDPAFVFVLIPMPHNKDERSAVHHFGFTLDSRAEVDAMAERGRAAGVLREPARDAGPVVGYFCILEDPDGNWVEFSFGQPINPRDIAS